MTIIKWFTRLYNGIAQKGVTAKPKMREKQP